MVTKADRDERRLDLRIPDEERSLEGRRTTDLVFQINQTNPNDPRCQELIQELYHPGEGTRIVPPVFVNLAENVTIGKRVSIQPYSKMMSAGRIVIEDDVLIAMNCSLITNNHDFYQRRILTIQDIHICQGAWLGAGVTVLPGVTIGRQAVIGAGSVVTRDIPDYAVAVGSPAKVVKYLDPTGFEE